MIDAEREERAARIAAGREAVEQADAALSIRADRYRGSLRFASVRGAMQWYLRARLKAASVPTAAPRTTRFHTGFDRMGRSQWGEARVSVDSSGGVGRGDTLALLFTIHRIVEQVAGLDDGRWRAYSLVHVEGMEAGRDKRGGRQLLTQAEAAKKLNASQASISRWIGWVEMQMRGPLKEAGVLV